MADINNKRQINIDLVKCFSIVFMIAIHTLMVYVEDLSTGFHYAVNSVLGGPLAAPVFMVSMGVGFAYSRNQEPNNLIKRGFNIIILGYVLNILISPMYIDFSEIVITKAFVIEVLASFFYGDILQFAGIAMIVFALLRKLKCNDTAILSVGVLLSLAGTLLPALNTDSTLVSSVGGLFLPVKYQNEVHMCFPFSAWFIFPAFGYWFGNRLKNVKNTDRFYLIFGGVSVPIAAAGLGIEIYSKSCMMSVGDVEFYLMGTHDAILSVFTALAMYSVCHFAVKVCSAKARGVMTRIGNSLNIIYMLSWVLIVLTQVAINCFVKEVTGLPLYFIMAATIVVSICLGVMLKRKIAERLDKKPNSFVKYINA